MTALSASKKENNNKRTQGASPPVPLPVGGLSRYAVRGISEADGHPYAGTGHSYLPTPRKTSAASGPQDRAGSRSGRSTNGIVPLGPRQAATPRSGPWKRTKGNHRTASGKTEQIQGIPFRSGQRFARKPQARKGNRAPSRHQKRAISMAYPLMALFHPKPAATSPRTDSRQDGEKA